MKKFACLALLLAAAALQPASASDWKMDPSASRLEFAATFDKVATPGVFKVFDTRLHFDPEKQAGNSLDVTIKIASADMTNTDINKAIAGPEWFDFAGHPQAEFHSSDIRRAASGKQSYIARGTLTLKGVQQPVEVAFTLTPTAEGATLEGGFVTQRSLYGIGTGEWTATDVIGPEVSVKFHVLLHKAA